MHKIAKLFVLALCLTLVGTLWASQQVRGPVAKYAAKSELVNPNKVRGYEMPEVGSRLPGSLDEVIISEDFEAVEHAALPDGWTQVDVDGGQQTVETIWPLDVSQWIVFDGTTVSPAIPGHSGDKFAANIYNSPAVANNDWLILPQQTLDGAIEFSFWAASLSSSWPESFDVRVSTTDAEPASFTEVMGTYTNIPIAYTEYSFDLSEFAGAPFYVAIHYISNDKLMLLVDDVLLTAGASGTIAGTVTALGTGNPISGATVTIDGGPTTTTGATGEYAFEIGEGTYTVEVSASGYVSASTPNVEVVGGEVTTVDFELEVSSTMTTDYPSAATPVAIPDQSPSGAAKTLTITDDYLIEDVDVTVNITHTYVSDLDLYLVAPWGDSVQLAEDPTTFPAGANMTNCRFDDEADAPFEYTATGAPYTGSWQPFGELEAFDGFIVTGAWRLRAVDNEAADTGTIGIFTIHIEHQISAADETGALPTEFAMQPAFPNPFNPSTQISFTVPVTSNAEMKVFNSLGQEVATLWQGTATAGTHTLYFMADNLPSGIYFAQLNAGSFVATQKIVLLK